MHQFLTSTRCQTHLAPFRRILQKNITQQLQTSPHIITNEPIFVFAFLLRNKFLLLRGNLSFEIISR